MKPLHSDHKGFTLIEVLLAIAIFALVAAGLYGVLNGSLRLEKKIKSVHYDCQQTRLAFDLLGRDLENMIAYPFNTAKSDRLAFEGHNDRIIFFVPYDTGIRQVEYYDGDIDFGKRSGVQVRRVKSLQETVGYKKGTGKRQYLVRSTISLKDILNGKNSQPETEALIEGLQPGKLKFQFGALSGGAGNQRLTFRDDWKNNALPDVIRVEMILEGSSEVELRRDFYIMVKGPLI